MLKLYKKSVSVLFLLSSLVSQLVIASDSEINFSGFASFVYAKTLSDAEEGPLDGISTTSDVRDFNRLGLRMDADLQNNLSFAAQIVSNGDNDYEPEIDWLFASYNFMPNVALSVGKFRAPLFMYSDYLDVGYGYQWITPPFDVYGVPSFNAIEGAKLALTFDLGGDWSSELLLWGGAVDEEEKTLDSDLIIKDSLGLAVTVERDWLSLRAVHYVAEASADIHNQLFALEAGFVDIEMAINAQAGTTLSLDPLRDDLAFSQEDSTFTGLGVFVDFDHFFLAAESTVIDVDKTIAVGDLRSHYVMAGVRLPANWSVSVTYSINDDKTKKEVYQQYDELIEPYIGIDTDLDVAISQLRDALVMTTETLQSNESDTYTLGARWDFHKQAALKMEYLIQDSSIKTRVASIDNDRSAYRLALDLVF